MNTKEINLRDGIDYIIVNQTLALWDGETCTTINNLSEADANECIESLRLNTYTQHEPWKGANQ